MNVQKYNIGLTFGAYDLCHSGHINLLRNAKKRCKYLIVYVSNDQYIKKYKGHTPLIPLKERLNVIKSLKFVDKVGVQSINFTKKDAIKRHKPDVLIVGNDWNKNTYSGMNLGVPVIFLPYTREISSTTLRKNIIKVLKSEMAKKLGLML